MLDMKNKIHAVFLGLLLLLIGELNAQCNITATGPICVDEPVLFDCNSIGSSNFNWDFNGEGSNNSLCNPTFKFSTPGKKVIKLSLKLASGSICNSNLTIDVKPKPTINVRRLVNKNQCFANNSFCFSDSSKSDDPSSKICKTIYVFDDGTKYEYTGNGPRTFCHSFQDPAGGVYGLTIEVQDCNGCITKKKYDAIAIVQASLGLSFNSPQPKRCDSVQLCVTNNSSIPLDSIKSFTWDWGDGIKETGDKTSSNLWNSGITNGVCHWFKTQGPNGGDFNTTLTVTSNFGCTESFQYKSSATNLLIKPVIIADYDSLCFENAIFSFKLKDGQIPQAANPFYIFEQPALPQNISRQWTGTHRFSEVGPFKISFSFTHTIPGCSRTVYDTIIVIGPQSEIENSVLIGKRYIEDYQRYQCVIKDTVDFYNFSTFYHNDRNKTDDDSLIIVYDSVLVDKTSRAILPTSTSYDPAKHEWVYSGFNNPLVHGFLKDAGKSLLTPKKLNRGNDCTVRIWDFDDDFCERCTTDTKKGINVGINCKYSKDSLPSHWYTPWDTMYQTRYSLLPERALDFDSDSGLCGFKRMWSDDSVAIIRDTILYYGDNSLAIKTKDSTIYQNIKNKVKVKSQLNGPSSLDIYTATKFYIPPGDTVYVDSKNGLPPNRWIGLSPNGRYLTVQPGQAIIIKSSTDRAYYNVWMKTIQDTIPLHMLQPWHKLYMKESMKIAGYSINDSVNSFAHRQKFFTGPIVRCYIVKLRHKDICHPLACENEHSISLALMPPSAKKLKKKGTLCLGGDQDNYGITFDLTDVKPGCTRSWAEINFDTSLNKAGWVKAIGPNLTAGSISTGGLPPINPPYGIAPGGYQGNGPAPSTFSKQFTVDDIKDTITGYINVGLIVGNGIWPTSGADYPAECVDTVYYEKFARFPILDNRFRIIRPDDLGGEATKICRFDTISLTTMPWNRTYVPDVEEATWSMTGANVGKYYNQYYILSVNERYERFSRIKGDNTPLTPNTMLEDRLQIVKRSFFDGKSTTLDSQNIRIARILKWHIEADVTPVFDIVKTILSNQGIDIYDLSPQQLNQLIWNGIGTVGKPFTGARGCLDTTGFGRFIRFYKVADQKDSIHFRDTTLIPIDYARTSSGSQVHAYSFVPQYSGFYIANYGLRSRAPENCTKSTGTAKKVIVGFYSQMNYTDTILCHGQKVLTSPFFRYFEVAPDIMNRLLDPRDWWRDRITEAGNTNREGYTKHDLNKNDDGTHSNSIFGGYPYSVVGMDNAPNLILQLGGGAGSLYYNKDTGDVYLIRTAATDSFGCHDTIPQNIYVTSVRAKFKLDQTRPQCNTIVELFDSSYLFDPCISKLGNPCDKIIKWTVFWGDNSSNSVNTFFNNLPNKIGHDYTKNGKFKVKWRVESALGCISWDSTELYIPGPEPFFDTLISRKYCVGDVVKFSNLSKYQIADSSIWLWSFGDGGFGNQYLDVSGGKDTISHQYLKSGKYKISLYHYFLLKVDNTVKRCMVQYPDSNANEPVFEIEVFAKDSVDILADKYSICVGDSVNLSGSIFKNIKYSKYRWDFSRFGGDTLITSDTSVSAKFIVPGKYRVTFSGDINSTSSNDKICPIMDSLTIKVGDVKADFEIDTTGKPNFCFDNKSTNSVSHRWSFYSNVDLKSVTPASARVFIASGNQNDYNNIRICEDYRDSVGKYWVCLEATNETGCKDTICKQLNNDFREVILPPNVFTPNNSFTGLDPEGKQGNEVFNIIIEGESKYELVIYDRWGVKVFESNNKEIDWNGKLNNTGPQCPDGTYYYILKYRYKGNPEDEPLLNGTVRIIR